MLDKHLTLVIQWPRFGPSHVARLDAAFEQLGRHQVRVVGLETASADDVYAWIEGQEPTSFERHVAFPGQSAERVPSGRMWQGFRRSLAAIEPDVVAINGKLNRLADGVLPEEIDVGPKLLFPRFPIFDFGGYDDCRHLYPP